MKLFAFATLALFAYAQADLADVNRKIHDALHTGVCVFEKAKARIQASTPTDAPFCDRLKKDLKMIEEDFMACATEEQKNSPKLPIFRELVKKAVANLCDNN